MTRWGWIFLIVCLYTDPVWGQDLDYVRNVVERLASPEMHGRGYVKDGDRKAADYIAREYRHIGLNAFGKSYFQDFTLNINTFPGKIRVDADHTPLLPGKDFTISCNSPGTKGTFRLEWPPAADSAILFSIPPSQDLQDAFLVLDDSLGKFRNMSAVPYKGLIFLNENKLWWHIIKGKSLSPFITIDMKQDALPSGTPSISLDFKTIFLTDYVTRNVIGYIQGNSVPDTFLVFTAHYDHLGMMGKDAYFPGAHDNASGTAMMLDLAKYYMQPENRPEYSMVFMAFSGEETGLLGSRYYTRNELFPNGNIRFLINLDLVSTGSEGIMVVNGEVFKKEFEWLLAINEEEKLVKEVKKRGPASNSDHYPFYELGVPCFFLYTLGEYKEYHTVDDKPEMLPFTAYEEVFTLITRFIGHFE